MDVRKPGVDSRAWHRSVADIAVVVGLATASSLPALVVPGYTRFVSTALVLTIVGGGTRLFLGAVVALPGETAPTEPVPDPPPASVIVTAYDEADVLAETLAACRALAYPADSLEIIVCYEAASSDGTAAIAEAAATADPRVRAVERTEPPAGKAAVTNAGLAEASGDVVAVLDADQRLAPDALLRAVSHLSVDGVRCVTGRRYGCNGNDSLVARLATVEHHLAERVEFVARDRLGLFTIFTGGQAVFDADALADGFDETVLLEDLAAACRIQAGGGAIRVDPAILSDERNPATVRSLWNQRVRWARGGMQVVASRLPSLFASGAAPLRVRLDAALTLGALLVVPVLVLTAPSLLLVPPGAGGGPLLPGWWPTALVLAGFGGPVGAFVGVAVTDSRRGLRHAPREYLAAAALPLYWALQTLAILRAFLDEFVLQGPVVYVTS